MLDRREIKLELSSRRKSSWSLVFWKPSELPAPKPRAQGHGVVVPLCNLLAVPSSDSSRSAGGGFAFVLPVAGAMGYLGEQPRTAHS